MSLLLIETTTPADEGARTYLDRIAAAIDPVGADFVEAQVTADGKVFVIADLEGGATSEATLAALAGAGIGVEDSAPVRLVGADLAQIKATRPAGQYLVEWDIPAGISMDAYLTRKAEKSPLYDQVPDVQFLRTYVREDMVKCLCFYDGQDEAAVRRARDVVSTPVDRLHELDTKVFG
ncbi:DUF4242 domain-containing protein [Occultella glacieicola]|uniref:DUF4242 domain-containing protein n=1 Tax=Occultella glacieicola TaxID=2518684 RepID=A0ABY2E0Z6_9MICO|nr:DUF4242 domain-containing protein [Occultella glacieicola]TDE89640.1 DUF4242 domain-containing protein [Occultella glacieicola]